MEETEKTKEVNISLNKAVFFPPWISLIVMVIVSLANGEAFLSGLNRVTGWILKNFTWAFNLTTVGCIVTVIIVYFSPLGKVRIGGSKAKPMMNYMNLVWITLCTTIAAGILFWACAEPLYHFYQPASFEGVEAGSAGAAVFAMKTMFLEWTWSPYAIYTVATVIFAFVFYNMKKSFSIGSALIPVFGEKAEKYDSLVNVICLFALAAGVAASLGTGTLTIAGGIQKIFGIKSGPVSWAVIIVVIVVTFVASSVSGIMKGVRILSDINAKTYIVLLAFLMIFGPTSFIMNFSLESYGAYIRDFLPMSFYTGEIFKDSWAQSWPVFYWCNWLAWTPITAVFLAKILKGYTVKEAIRCNFIIPSLFSTLWMSVFASSAIYYEMNGKGFYEMMQTQGTESVVYAVFEQMPLSKILMVFYLFIVFISFVTASDSNTNAMAGLCTTGITDGEQESPVWLKVVWGLTIGIITWILISFAGIDGIKAASNLGGFPNMFLVIIMIIGLLKICKNPSKYDTFKEDYDENGNPIEHGKISNKIEEERI